MSKTEKHDGGRLIASQAELVGSITHELKGMLSSVEGGLYLIDSGVNKSNNRRISQGMQMLRRNVDRIKRNVSSVLYYVKDRKMDWQVHDTEELLKTAVSALEDRSAEFGARLKAELASYSIECDDFAVFSLLLNIADYALEASGASGEEFSPQVTLTVTADEDQVRFGILARGFEMDQATRDIILGEFYSPIGVMRKHLPVFIANKLVKAHGGKLDIDTAAAENQTSFSVQLPRVRAERLDEKKEGYDLDYLEREWNS